MSFMDAVKAAEAAITEDVVENEEEVSTGGSKFKFDDNGIYPVTIEMAVARMSQSSKSAWYEVTFKGEEGQTIKTKYFVLDKDSGLPYKIKDGTKKFLFGYDQMKALTYLTTGEANGLPETERKQIKEYDYDLKTEVPVERDVVMSLINKRVNICVNITEEDGYPDATKSRKVANVRHVCDIETKKFMREKLAGEEATRANKFLEVNPSGKVIDKRDLSKGGSTNDKAEVTPANVGFGS